MLCFFSVQIFNEKSYYSIGLAGAFDLLKKNKDDDEEKEDPITKAEREFFEIIKKVREVRVGLTSQKASLMILYCTVLKVRF